jgi:hypothetical protein
MFVADVAGDIAIVVWLVVLPLVLLVCCLLKGKYWFCVIGIFFGIVWLVGAIRLAKPNSRWARRYGPEKLYESKRRFPKEARKIDPAWAPPVLATETVRSVPDPDQWPDEHPATWDKITRKAYKRQYGHEPEEDYGPPSAT